MKKIVIALTLLSASAFGHIADNPSSGFVPHKKATETFLTTDYIYLKDKHQQYWRTSTNCSYNIDANSVVSVKPLDSKIGLNSSVKLTVNGQEMICRVTDFHQASADVVSVFYNR